MNKARNLMLKYSILIYESNQQIRKKKRKRKEKKRKKEADKYCIWGLKFKMGRRGVIFLLNLKYYILNMIIY